MRQEKSDIEHKYNRAQTELKEKSGEISGLRQEKMTAETAEKQLKVQLSQSQTKLNDAERIRKSAEEALKQQIRQLEVQIQQQNKDNDRLKRDLATAAKGAEENITDKDLVTMAEHVTILADYRQKCVNAMNQKKIEYEQELKHYTEALSEADEECRETAKQYQEQIDDLKLQVETSKNEVHKLRDDAETISKEHRAELEQVKSEAISSAGGSGCNAPAATKPVGGPCMECPRLRREIEELKKELQRKTATIEQIRRDAMAKKDGKTDQQQLQDEIAALRVDLEQSRTATKKADSIAMQNLDDMNKAQNTEKLACVKLDDVTKKMQDFERDFRQAAADAKEAREELRVLKAGQSLGPSTAEEENLKRKVADLEAKNRDMETKVELLRKSNIEYRDELEQAQYQLQQYEENEEWDEEDYDASWYKQADYIPEDSEYPEPPTGNARD